MKSFIWSLPMIIHDLIKFFSGYILVAYLDAETLNPISNPRWVKWDDYLDNAGNFNGEWGKLI